MIPKFRAWDKKLQTMLDVSLIDFKKGVLVGEHWKFGETNFMSFDEIELMQSTGLFDRNGKEIFEGDILKSNKYITSVFYERGAYCVKFRRTTNTTVTMNVISFIEKYKTKIIGNIYENKELLDA
nr:MAG TPA: YopX protein [Caudoviricetes sp.]